MTPLLSNDFQHLFYKQILPKTPIKSILYAGAHFQIARLVPPAALRQFPTRCSTKPGGSSSTTHRRISVPLLILLIPISSTGSHRKLLPSELHYPPLHGSSVSVTQSLLCPSHVSPWLIGTNPSVSTLSASTGRST